MTKSRMHVCLALLAISFCSLPSLAVSLTEASKRPLVKDFALNNLKNKQVRLRQHLGQVVVVNFWATWCGPCTQELQHLNRFYQKYKKQNMTVLALATDDPETQAKIKPLVRRRRWKMPVLVDREGTVSAILNPRGVTPYTLFVDNKGRLAHIHEGYTKGDELKYEQIIERLLQESKS